MYLNNIIIIIIKQIEDLVLDKIYKLEKIKEEEKDLFEKFTSLKRLTLNEVGLTSLENFPKLNELQIVRNHFLLLFDILFIQLELSNNKLKGEDLDIIANQCPNIYKIKLDSNQIQSIDILKPLAKLENLKKISVKGNPFCESNENYQKELFEMINTLETIDSHNKNGDEVETSEYEDEEDKEDKEAKELSEEEDEGEEFDDDDDVDEEYDEEDEGDDDHDEDNDEDNERPKKKQKK